MAHNISSQNIRNIINNWITAGYTIKCKIGTDTTETDITNTIECVWDGSKYLIYSLDSAASTTSGENGIEYRYIGTGEEFLSKVSLVKTVSST